jgi:hypothetical protein
MSCRAGAGADERVDGAVEQAVGDEIIKAADDDRELEAACVQRALDDGDSGERVGHGRRSIASGRGAQGDLRGLC